MILGVGYLQFFDKSPQLNELIEFEHSSGVMNKYKFDEIGLKVGDTIGDIYLFDGKQGAKVNLKELMRKDSKPTALITGSYTCDVTRLHMKSIDSLYSIYRQDYDFFLVHTLEAHPLTSPSPYSTELMPWEATRNIEAGIAAKQPSTLGERKKLAEQWIQEENIQPPVLIDNAQNEFWKQVGQGPNMAIILSASGEVLYKEGWFNPETFASFLGPQ